MDQSNLKMTSNKSESSTRIIEEAKEKEKKSDITKTSDKNLHRLFNKK